MRIIYIMLNTSIVTKIGTLSTPLLSKHILIATIATICRLPDLILDQSRLILENSREKITGITLVISSKPAIALKASIPSNKP